MTKTTLPTDSQARKGIPIVSGCLDYFPAALAGVARVSKAGNDKHNPGQPLHHARAKSSDHPECVMRHLIDLRGLLAAYGRADGVSSEDILAEVSALAWRALALSQELHELFGAPLAPGARLPAEEPPAEPSEKKYLIRLAGSESRPFWVGVCGSGYTAIRAQAGRYTRQEAEQMMITGADWLEEA